MLCTTTPRGNRLDHEGGADEPAQATVHAVHAHAEAGRRLAVRVGRLGFLARELRDEVPGVLDERMP